VVDRACLRVTVPGTSYVERIATLRILETVLGPRVNLEGDRLPLAKGALSGRVDHRDPVPELQVQFHLSKSDLRRLEVAASKCVDATAGCGIRTEPPSVLRSQPVRFEVGADQRPGFGEIDAQPPGEVAFAHLDRGVIELPHLVIADDLACGPYGRQRRRFDAEHAHKLGDIGLAAESNLEPEVARFLILPAAVILVCPPRSGVDDMDGV
jgi:hypothetical protein